MIPVRASVKWLLTAVVVLSEIPLVAQVLPGEEGMLEQQAGQDARRHAAEHPPGAGLVGPTH